MRKKLLSILALLCLTVTSAWAQWNGGTYTATANETINSTINVTADATLTINAGVTVTVNRSITVANGKTLTIDGPGTLTVYGTDGANGTDGGNGINSVAAITGNITVQGATVNAIGGAAGNGGDSSTGNGGKGATGARGLSNGTVTIYSGTINATGGKGGNGGNSTAGQGGDGGQGGYAFVVTALNYHGGIVNATSGAVGKGGTGSAGNGSDANRRKAFGGDYLTLHETTGVTLLGDGANITPATKPTVTGKYTVNIVPNVTAFGTCGTTGHESDVIWTLTNDGVMTVSGMGAMKDYASAAEVPWYNKMDAITSVVIVNGVTSIGGYAFRNCSTLASITFGSSLTTIGRSAFHGCTGLSSVDLPDNLTEIGTTAFYGCNNLTSILIPASVTSIKTMAFDQCSSLATVYILATSLTEYGSNAFRGTASGLKIYVPKRSLSTYKAGWSDYNNKIEEIPIAADGNCGTEVTYSLTIFGELTISGTGAMAKYDPYMTKAPWDGYKASITSVVIESGVESIGEYAFNQCANLASVTIPTGVTSIGKSAFSGCSSLTTITIPASVTTIGNGAFGSTGLTEVTIPASVTTLGTSVFTSCTSLTTVSISADLTSIGMSLFSGCSQLASVNIPASVTSIDGAAFYNCSNLTSISIPASVTSIGSQAFRNCTSLTSIDLPANLTTIGVYAFYGCNNASLTTISIPASVTSIGQSAFRNCSNLGTVTLNSNPTIGTDAFTGIADGAAVTMNLTANTADGAKWMTFYNKLYSFEADENTQVFKARLSGTSITLYEVTDKIVDAGTAVVLKTTGGGDPVMTLTTSASSNADSNSLEGVSDAAGLTAADPSTTFVLNNGTNGVGFYKLKAGKTLGVGKAYLTYDSSTAPSFLGFDETTGMNDVRCKTEDVRGEYYNLNGQRVAQPTKGLYIVNGKKVVIK